MLRPSAVLMFCPLPASVPGHSAVTSSAPVTLQLSRVSPPWGAQTRICSGCLGQMQRPSERHALHCPDLLPGLIRCQTPAARQAEDCSCVRRMLQACGPARCRWRPSSTFSGILLHGRRAMTTPTAPHRHHSAAYRQRTSQSAGWQSADRGAWSQSPGALPQDRGKPGQSASRSLASPHLLDAHTAAAGLATPTASKQAGNLRTAVHCAAAARPGQSAHERQWRRWRQQSLQVLCVLVTTCTIHASQGMLSRL